MRLPPRALSILAGTFLLAAVVGCESTSSTSPSVSGFAVGGTRVVSMGDDVVIRMPAADSGESTWRLTSFDSQMLRLTQRARLERRQSDGRLEWTFRFVARIPGETEVVLTRTASDSSGEAGERRRFRIRIRG